MLCFEASGAPPDNDNRTLPPVASLILLNTIALRMLAPGKCHFSKKLLEENAPQNIFSFNPVPLTRPIIPFRIDSQTAGILIISMGFFLERGGRYPTRMVGRNSLMSPLQLRVDASVKVFTVA